MFDLVKDQTCIHTFLSNGTNSHWWTQNSYYLETDVKGIDNSDNDKVIHIIKECTAWVMVIIMRILRIRELNQQSQSISTHFPQLLSFLWWLCCQSTSCKRWKVPSCCGLMKSLLKEHNPWGLCSTWKLASGALHMIDSAIVCLQLSFQVWFDRWISNDCSSVRRPIVMPPLDSGVTNHASLSCSLGNESGFGGCQKNGTCVKFGGSGNMM